MEKPETDLEVFSALSLLEYVRLMTAAHYINMGTDSGAARFVISPEDFAKMEAEPLQTPLIGLSLNYKSDEKILEVTADEAFLHLYENKIMNEVARVFAINYKNRYASRIMAENV